MFFFEDFTMLTPFLRFFHRFYPFFAIISLSLNHFPFCFAQQDTQSVRGVGQY